MSNYIRHFDAPAPINAQLEVTFNARHQVQYIGVQLYGKCADSHEVGLHRAAIFVRELLKAAAQKEKLIEDAQRHLKGLKGFALEYAMVKVLAEAEADRLRAALDELFHGKAA